MSDDHHPTLDDDALSIDDDDPSKPARNLIVNYIPNSVDEAGLRSLFQPIGNVEAVKIVIDKASGVSLGYGFVVFENAADAERAISALNGHEIGNKKLKVGYAHAGRKENSHLYVAGLEKTLSKDDIVKVFAPFGTVEEVKILREPGSTVSRGVAFVHFSSRKEAESALNNLNNATLPGASGPLSVKFADVKKKPSGRSGGGSHGMWPMAHQNMYSLQQGIYPYQTMNNVYQQQQQQQQQFRPQQVQPIGGLGGNSSGNSSSSGSGGFENVDSTLFVFNLPANCDESLLYSLFSPFGQLTSVKVVRDPATRACKGFGFVSLGRRDEAMLAVSQLHGTNLYGKVLQVSFKKPKQGM